MTTLWISPALDNALTAEEVVELVNGGTCEGMEGIELTPSMLAGQYAANAAKDSADHGVIEQADIEGHLEFLHNFGATFDFAAATEHGMRIVKAREAEQAE